MNLGGIGLIEQGQGAIGRDGGVPVAQMFRGAGKRSMRDRDQRIDRKEAPGVLGHALPVLGCLVELHQPEVGRARVAILRGQLFEDLALGAAVCRLIALRLASDPAEPPRDVGGGLAYRGGQVLARAVTWHAEHRVLLNGDRTVVFH